MIFYKQKQQKQQKKSDERREKMFVMCVNWLFDITLTLSCDVFKHSQITDLIKCSFLTSRAHRWFQSCWQCTCSSPALEGRSRWRRRSRRTADPGLHALLAVGCSPEDGRSQKNARRTERPETTELQSLQQTAGGQKHTPPTCVFCVWMLLCWIHPFIISVKSHCFTFLTHPNVV